MGPSRSYLSGLRLFLAVITFFGVFTLFTSSRLIPPFYPNSRQHIQNWLESGIYSRSPNGDLSAGSDSRIETPSGPTESDENPVKIAHVISLITCHKAARTRGFLDALIVLRHSIHLNSIHNGRGRYSYQMYAILHQDGGCLPHLDKLRRVGYIPLVKETPVNLSDIKGEWYRKHVEQENCCGSKEFIKLYAYTLMEHPVVVHWDLDVAVLQPMDELYDSMLFPANSDRGMQARKQLLLQRPDLALPEKIDAFYTRDITSAAPTEKVTAVQGGFVVARPDLRVLEAYKEFILEGNYARGRGEGSGWGGLGYGGFQGAMAYQGVLAYYYDIISPGVSVELDVCRWNNVVADVIWRGPNLIEHKGQCRQFPVDGNFETNTPDLGKCEDCRILPIAETKTVHYTACKKPWECTIPHPRNPRDKRQVERLNNLTNITTCGVLVRKYFDFRQDIEERIKEASALVVSDRGGQFHRDVFNGYCKKSGSYIPMEIPEDFDIKSVYGF